MISASAAVSTIITLIIVGLIFWLLWWLLNYHAPPEPFLKVGNIVLTVLAVLVIIGIPLSLINDRPIFRP